MRSTSRVLASVEAPARISVIVPVHNGGEAFHVCTEALLRALGPEDELIVVADGESDGAWRALDPEDARVVVLPETRGPAAARNHGARLASGDLLFFVDADVTVSPDALDRVRQRFADGPTLDALIGSYDDAPGHAGFLSQYRNLLHHHTHQTAREDVLTFWGACGAMRRATFERLGGFNERYDRPCIEDIELGYRLTASGGRIRLAKDLQVKHLKEWTARSTVRTDLFARAMPWTELLLRRRAMENNLNICVRNRASVAAVWSLPLAALAALWLPGLASVAAVGMVALVVALNRSFYALTYRRHGLAFTLKVLPWHLLYFAYSGLGFILGVGATALSGPRRRLRQLRSLTIPSRNLCTTSPPSSSVPGRPG